MPDCNTHFWDQSVYNFKIHTVPTNFPAFKCLINIKSSSSLGMKPSISTQRSKEGRFKNNTSVAAISNCQTDGYLNWRARNTSFSA
jgi:hypothetical protein